MDLTQQSWLYCYRRERLIDTVLTVDGLLKCPSKVQDQRLSDTLSSKYPKSFERILLICIEDLSDLSSLVYELQSFCNIDLLDDVVEDDSEDDLLQSEFEDGELVRIQDEENKVKEVVDFNLII